MPRRLTTNVEKLIIRKMSRDAIPPGGSAADGIKFLLSGKMAQAARDATKWVEASIAAVRGAAEPNPWKDKSDEEIAAELVRQIDQRLNRRSN